MLQIPLLEHQQSLNIQLDKEGKRQIYDPIRRQFVALLPEEMVRQLWLCHLTQSAGYPQGKIAVEYALKVHQRNKRCDILVFDAHFQPWMIVECKAPQVVLSTTVFEQAAIYNITLKVPYLLVSNGIGTYCAQIDHEREDYIFLEDLPCY